MEIIAIVAAAVAAWIWGAIWYTLMGKRWMKASGLTEQSIDPKNKMPHVVSFVCALLTTAGMYYLLQQIAAEGMEGMVFGLGMGLLIVLPWMINQIVYGQRSKALIWIDGAYPVIGLGIIGLVLTLLAPPVYVY